LIEELLFIAGGTYVINQLINTKRNTIGKINLTIKNLGLGTKTPTSGKITWPKLVSKRRTDYGWDLLYALPYGRCLEDFIKENDRFNQAVNGEVWFEIHHGFLKMTVMERDLPDKCEFDMPYVSSDITLPIFLGYSRRGPEIYDLTEFPHMLIGGLTRFGKSNFIRQLITVLKYHRPETNITIIDLKRIEFNFLKDYVNYAYSFHNAVVNIEFLHNEAFRRMEILDKHGVEKIQLYNGKDLPYEVLIIDEFSHLCPDLAKGKSEKKAKEYVHNLLVELICVARALGIHIIVCTQRPDAQVVPGQLKAELGATMAFCCRNEVNSRILLDHGGAAYLPRIPGRAIFQFDTEKEIQVAWMPKHVCLKWLRGAVHENESTM